MTLTSAQKLFKPSVILITLGVLILGFTCSGMASHASMHGDMNSIATTQISNQQICCNTIISKHVASLKSALLFLPREVKDGLFLLQLGLAAAFAFVGLRLRHDPDGHQQFSYRFYIRDNPEFALFNQLKLAFARGILNPKIY